MKKPIQHKLQKFYTTLINFKQMKKAYIIHENDEWIEPLRIYLRRLQVPFEEWHMDRLVIKALTALQLNWKKIIQPYEQLFSIF